MSEHATPSPFNSESDVVPSNDSVTGSEADDKLTIASVHDERLEIHLTADRSINLAQQQCGIPVVKLLTLTSHHAAMIENVRIHVEIEDEVAESFEVIVGRVPAGGTITIPGVDLALRPSVLRLRTEKVGTRIIVTAEGVALDAPVQEESDGRLPSGRVFVRRIEPVEVLAWNEWGGSGGLTEILATFVQPNDPFVAKILQAARLPLKARVGDDSFDGYQSKNPSRIVNLVGALMEGAAGFRIGYISTAASFEEQGQKVRLPETLERDRQGNCLDLTLLLAAACEQAGLHPILVLIEGHIVLGVWTSDQCFPEAVVDVASRVLNRAANREILLVESTAIAQGERFDFETAIRRAGEQVEDHRASMVAVDVQRARKLKFLPLSSRLDGRTPGSSGEQDEVIPKPRSSGTSPLSIPIITAPDDAAEKETPKTRADKWKQKLLDLTLRNRLLNFKAGKKTLEFFVPDLGRLEDLLQNEKKFSVSPPPDLLKGVRDLEALRRSEGIDVTDVPLMEAIEAGILSAPESPEEIEKRLTAIYREARTMEEESGSNNLFLTLGQLRWFESDSSSQERFAPIILLPVSIEKGARGGFKISLTGEEPRSNITLLQKLRSDFGVETSGLDELPTDDAGIDVPRVLATFRDRIKDKNRWEVIDKAFLGLLQFSKFVLWRDLENHIEELAESPVVQLLLNGSSESLRSGEPLPSADGVDKVLAPGDLLCPLDADSSQIAAILAASDGRTLVLQGPPGTGKSQTITNLIAHSLASGKRVLFVAEKAAALEVVQSRLEKVGLGDACLAIHSNKAGKREVLAQIKKALDSTGSQRPSDWDRTLRELTQRRDELNGYVQDLHHVHPCGYSFFRATGELARLGDGPRIGLVLSDPLRTDPARFDALRQAAREIEVTAREVLPIAEHPFLGVELDQWSPMAEQRIGDLASGMAKAARKLSAARDAVTGPDQLLPAPAEGGLAAPSLRAMTTEVKLAQSLLDCPGASHSLLEVDNFSSLQGQLQECIRQVVEESKAADGLRSRWEESFLNLDPAEWSARASRVQKSFVLVRWMRRKELLRDIAAHSRADESELSLEALRRDLDNLKEWSRTRKNLQATRDITIKHLSSAHGEDGRLDPSRAEAVLRWTQHTRPHLENLDETHPSGSALGFSFVRYATARDGARLRSAQSREALQSFVDAHAEMVDARKALVDELQLNEAVAIGSPNEDRFLERITTFVDGLEQNRHRLRHWAAWLQVASEGRAQGLTPLIDALCEGLIDATAVSATVERSLCQLIAEAALVAKPRLQRFHRDSHERRISEFQQLDRDLLDVSRQMAQARCRESIPNLAQASTSGEAGILRREVGKQKRHISIRRLFAELPTLLPKIKPCLLMSPISVAHYLSPKWQADIVIFDEASQIPVPDAVGALGRGKAAVVVGDSKQLPPTAFFSKVSDDEEEDAEMPHDLQSILEECEASGVPSLNLGWHYRSQHESLIAFSNHHYYDNRLHTFPSAAESIRGLGVRHVHLPDAVYDKGKSRANRGEAEAIIAEIIDRCREAKALGTTPSIGVVAFSQAQASLIEDLLDEAARTNDLIEAVRRAEHDPLFIKNLENVQGDERDTILFSICYGPDVAGKVTMNFGPLNKPGGERRLNVAITRARKELVVFSRLVSDDIDLRRTQALGAQHLKVFLDYAVRGPSAIAEATRLHHGADFDSPFEKAVFDALVARGHQVDIQVGCSGYRIDLAVRHPEKPGRYVIGIECDGASYHSAASARDRDRLRQSVLEGLGWQLHRIWSTDYWADARKEIDRAEEAIRSATAASDMAPSPKVDEFAAGFSSADSATGERSSAVADRAMPPIVDDARKDNFAALDAGEIPSVGPTEPVERELKIAHQWRDDPESIDDAPAAACTQEFGGALDYIVCGETAPRQLLESGDTSAILKIMAAIIEVEAPIEKELLYSRTIAAFGVARLGSKIRQTLTRSHSPLARRGFRLEDGVFWASDQRPEEWRGYRVPTDSVSQRSLDAIPLAELANALEHQLQLAFGLPTDDLLRAAAKLFGINSLGRHVRERMQLALDRLVSTGRAVADGDQIRLPG